MKLINFQSRMSQGGKVQAPYYTNQVVFDVYQKADEEIVIGEAPMASTIVGIGRYNCTTENAQIYVTNDSIHQIRSEFRRAEILDDGELEEEDSVVVWSRVPAGTPTNSERFEFFAPITAIKVVFTGASGGKAVIALN
jgi:hypothetical protein